MGHNDWFCDSEFTCNELGNLWLWASAIIGADTCTYANVHSNANIHSYPNSNGYADADTRSTNSHADSCAYYLLRGKCV
jgi:hypothetical protein